MKKRWILGLVMAVILGLFSVGQVAWAVPNGGRSIGGTDAGTGASTGSGTSIGGATDTTSANSGDDCVQTTFFGEVCGREGEGIYKILNVALQTLTYGVGILGVLGLVVVSIQYITAGGNEQQVAKAKERIVQIVIGLAIYAVMFTLLQWLLPGGVLHQTSGGGGGSSQQPSGGGGSSLQQLPSREGSGSSLQQLPSTTPPPSSREVTNL